MPALLDRRLVVVTGKGGVGKTTVAAALGVLAASRGMRVALCEVAAQARLPALIGAAGPIAVSIDPYTARREWLRRQVRSRAVADILGRVRPFQLLTAAAPGLAELVTIGKVWDLAEGRDRYDLVILDGPATGHGIALLTAPRTYASLARVGPVHRQALSVDEFLRDRSRTAVLGVALPEEMPVNETLELEAALTREGLPLDAVVVNGLHPARFSRAEAERMTTLDLGVPHALRAAVGLALAEHERAAAQHSEMSRLRRRLGAPVTTLPFLFERELGRAEVELLSRELVRLP